MICTANKYYSSTNKCLYMKAYCCIDDKPYSMYSDILLYIIHDIILGIAKEKFEKMDIHTKTIKFGKYRYCVIEFIMEEDIGVESLDEFICIMKEQLEKNLYILYDYRKEYYIRKSVSHKKESQKNNFVIAKFLADMVLYNISDDDIFNEKIMLDYIKKLSKEKLNLFILGSDKYANACKEMVCSKCNVHITEPPQYYGKELRVRRSNGCNVLLWIFPMKASYKAGEIVSLIMGMELHKEIRDIRGLAYYVGCIFDKFENTISILIGTHHYENIKKIELIIKRVVYELKMNGVSENDLKKCEMYRKNQELYIIDEPLSYLSYKFENAVLGKRLTSEEHTSISMLKKALSSILYEEKVSIVVEICE